MGIYFRRAGEMVGGRRSRTQREEIEGRTRWRQDFESRKEEEHSGLEQVRGAYYVVFVSKQRQKRGVQSPNSLSSRSISSSSLLILSRRRSNASLLSFSLPLPWGTIGAKGIEA